MTFSPYIYLLLGLTALLGLGLIFSMLQRKKITEENSALKEKLLNLESQHLSQFSSNSAKKKIKGKNSVPGEDSNASKELLDSRRETAKLKDELRKAKEEQSERERDYKEQLEASEKKLFTTNEENKQFLEALREKDKELSQFSRTRDSQEKKSVDFGKEQERQNEVARLESNRAKQRVTELERSLKESQEKLDSLHHRLGTLQSELKKWREASTAFGGKPLDPVLFLRWRDRALEGKQMYTFMRRLREMSDDKLTTYQQGIELLSEYVLRSMGAEVPQVKSNEVKADRYLATAWSLLRERSMSSEKPPQRDVPDAHQSL